jgi:hypothetical protein
MPKDEWWEPLFPSLKRTFEGRRRKYVKKKAFYPLWQLRARVAWAKGRKKFLDYARRMNLPMVEEEEHPLEKI